jgi:hypothetical protein
MLNMSVLAEERSLQFPLRQNTTQADCLKTYLTESARESYETVSNLPAQPALEPSL